MKSTKYISLILLCGIMSSCSLSFKLSELSNEPKESNSEEQTPSEEDNPGEDVDEEAPYKVSEEYWNDKIYNLGFWINNQFEMFVHDVSDVAEHNRDYIIQVDHSNLLFSFANNGIIYYEYVSDNISHEYWVDQDGVLEDYFDIVDWKNDYFHNYYTHPLQFEQVTYNEEIHAYTCERYVDVHYSDTIVATDIVHKFENNYLNTVTEEIQYGTSPHISRTITFRKWGEITVEVPEEIKEQIPNVQ